MFGVPALCEIGGRGLVPRQHSAISTDAPDEAGAFVVEGASLGWVLSHVCGPRSRGRAAGLIFLSMGVLPCLLHTRAMSFHLGRFARFGCARSVQW